MDTEITTLEELADLINASSEWDIRFTDIIEENEWVDDADKDWGICHTATERLVFNEQGQAVVVPREIRVALTLEGDKEPVKDARDLRSAMRDLWFRYGRHCNWLEIDLIDLDTGLILTEEERKVFFDVAGCDKEIALGEASVSANIDTYRPFDEDEIKRIEDFAKDTPKEVRVQVNTDRVDVWYLNDVRFVSYPNRHLSHSHRYENIDDDAVDAARDAMEQVNAAINAIAVFVRENILGEDEELEVFESTSESFDIYREGIGGDYRIVDLADLCDGSMYL